MGKKRRKNNLRGPKFSLPKPEKGNKEVQSMFGSDIATGVGLDMTKRSDIKVGFGRCKTCQLPVNENGFLHKFACTFVYPAWLVLPVSQTRSSQVRDKSNSSVYLRTLK